MHLKAIELTGTNAPPAPTMPLSNAPPDQIVEIVDWPEHSEYIGAIMFTVEDSVAVLSPELWDAIFRDVPEPTVRILPEGTHLIVVKEPQDARTATQI